VRLDAPVGSKGRGGRRKVRNGGGHDGGRRIGRNCGDSRNQLAWRLRGRLRVDRSRRNRGFGCDGWGGRP